MQKVADAYNETAKTAKDPREREASLLIKSAVQMQYVKDTGDMNRAALYRALHYNRKLWTVFLASVAKEENPLPQDIKNNVASLAKFIFEHTLEIQARPEPEKLGSLININREIAAGLRDQAA